MKITSLSQLDLNKQYTYADYLTWEMIYRVELIKGFIHRMVPAPSRIHQEVSSAVQYQLYYFLQGKKYHAYSAPFDVRFVDVDGVIRDTVQPDISVICDETKLDDLGCVGAPDLILEILSPSSAQRDLKDKYDLYRMHGVKEYWVAHPEEKTMMIYTLNDQREYTSSRLFTRGDIVYSTAIEGFVLNLDEVFEPFDWKKVEEREATFHRM
jgi:Uma2 family endonuclease